MTWNFHIALYRPWISANSKQNIETLFLCLTNVHFIFHIILYMLFAFSFKLYFTNSNLESPNIPFFKNWMFSKFVFFYNNIIPKCSFLFASCSLKDYLPKEFLKVKNVEKKIFQQHASLNGLTDIEARVKYCHFCRSLKTYGITFFLVKVSSIDLKIFVAIYS